MDKYEMANQSEKPPIDNKNKLARATALALSATLALGGCANVQENIPEETAASTNMSEEEPVQSSIDAYIESLPDQEALVEEFRIPTGLNEDELAKTFVDYLNKWMSFGIGPEFTEGMNKEDRDYEISAAEIYEAIAQKASEAAGNAMFSEDLNSGIEEGMSKNEIQEFYQELNEFSLRGFHATTSGENIGVKPYAFYYEVTGVTSLAGRTDDIEADTMALRIELLLRDNSPEENDFDDLLELEEGKTYIPEDGWPMWIEVTFRDAGDGHYEITRIIHQGEAENSSND